MVEDAEVSVVTAVNQNEGSVGDSLASYLPKVDQFYIPEWLTMQFIANNLISFTPLFSYGSTIISIQQSQTALGFSIDICATMLIASILRVSYYLITPYEITLLRQALVMIFIQLILLKTTLNFRPDEYKYNNLHDVESFTQLVHDVWFEYFSTSKPPMFSEDWKLMLKSLSFRNLAGFSYKILLVFIYKFLKFFDPSYKRFKSFWQWDNDRAFWKFLMIFATLQLLLTFVISKVFNWESLSEWMGSLIGSLGLLIESLLPLPQIAILYKLKSVQGFKLILLVSWLCGDTLKITYLIFGANNISIIFLVFALFQMSLDFYIGGQYIYYRFYYDSMRSDQSFLEQLDNDGNREGIELDNFSLSSNSANDSSSESKSASQYSTKRERAHTFSV
ncbi:hypothetical protein HG535_0H03500 [Zygotorulaspora mrakii]|uniref:PQ-loop repeat-containing protein n=1 Tax=Zygotorulaspora mrakii TaxID=42260 RepID=A0A7H9B915_ZYGMR|nr:uncharacterized protein HG535_0H03500 [Zygotorulaspora mrakii]QLG75023.1 hypothetical protein HG535_0H03500 [Zygotorulaspora mrakii]